MGHAQLGAVARHLGHLFGSGTAAGSTEWQLLRRYLDRRDEVAFEAIVSRHGPMVLGVCRRVLGRGSPDVDDAFQGTFLTLAGKAEGLREHDPVGPWLHGVAFRMALRARSASARRVALERSARPPGSAEDEDVASRREQADLIDQELARLPRKYRAPVVLCYLEGLSHDEAARELGWPLGTVKGRLSRARATLKGRLTRRGLAPGAVAALVASAEGAGATLPAALLRSTIAITTASQGAGMVPATLAALTKGSLSTMILGKMKTALTIVLGTGAAVWAFQGQQPHRDATKPKLPAAKPVENPERLTPLPGPARSGLRDLVIDQEINAPVPTAGPAWASLPAEPPDNNYTSKAILTKLDERVTMPFPNETPLEDVLKYIKQSTMDEAAGLAIGIPVYVDPQGLQDADQSLASTVRIDLQNVPLRTTLELALKQLGLLYYIRDGLLIITAATEEDTPSPIKFLRGKAERGELTREQYKQLIELLKLREEVRNLESGFKKKQ